MTDRPDLDRIEGYCDAATPGPFVEMAAWISGIGWVGDSNRAPLAAPETAATPRATEES